MNGIFFNYPNSEKSFFAITQKEPVCKPKAPSQNITSDQVEEENHFNLALYEENSYKDVKQEIYQY